MIDVGKKYHFDTHGEDDDWKMFDGKECTVLRPLDKNKTDEHDPGRVWAVRFDDPRHTEIYVRDHELFGPYQPKIALISESTVFTLITDLPYGEDTDTGNRMSRYFDIATVMGRKSFVKAALIEDKNGLSPEGRGYRLHILNDVDKLDGYFLETDHLDETELSKLLADLAYDLSHGRK